HGGTAAEVGSHRGGGPPRAHIVHDPATGARWTAADRAPDEHVRDRRGGCRHGRGDGRPRVAGTGGPGVGPPIPSPAVLGCGGKREPPARRWWRSRLPFRSADTPRRKSEWRDRTAGEFGG